MVRLAPAIIGLIRFKTIESRNKMYSLNHGVNHLFHHIFYSFIERKAVVMGGRSWTTLMSWINMPLKSRDQSLPQHFGDQ